MASCVQDEAGGCGGAMVECPRYTSTGLRSMESEDSSYDSDTEARHQHEDVSRTASETLAAEYAEYVTADRGYCGRVEFGLKLGYTEAQVLAAHQKLGARPTQNELLAELIKLGSRKPAPLPNPTPVSGEDLAVPQPAVSEDDAASQLRPIVIDGSNVAIRERTSLTVEELGKVRGTSRCIWPASAHPELCGNNALRKKRGMTASHSIVSAGWRRRDLPRQSSLPPPVVGEIHAVHGNKEFFSCRGIQICVEWFKARGHREITVFVPRWRKEAAANIRDQDILGALERERRLVFTPSRTAPGGKRLVCYDDRYVLNLAAQVDGVVVSNDNYRDLVAEKPEFKKVVEERLLMYSFVNDRFMPPEDPLGRHGPDLDTFLRKQPAPPPEPLPPVCPYGKKCTYGNKCKYHHPERGNQPQKTITERLAEHAKQQMQEVKSRGLVTAAAGLQDGDKTKDGKLKKTPLSRTKSLVPQPTVTKEFVTEKASLPEGILFYQSQAPWGASLVGDSGSHLTVAKRLSDPDQATAPAPPEENLHRKLQRQLTLNPGYDPRLVQDYAGGPQRLLSPFQDASILRASSQENLKMYLGPSAGAVRKPSGLAPHRPVARLGSDGRLSASAVPPHLWGDHPNVTRIASAPDSYRQWPPAARMQRLNSTSDTRLNHFSDMPPPNFHRGQLPSHFSLRSPSPMWPPPTTEDPRSKLYYHLSSIFPEEQVRTAMDLYPEETNPQKICAAILTLFPKG
ncbi:ZC3H12C [Cordylochernes scorpioides]|uniref:ZC3H12C n=1 Tax=Cordylochernes scorpioides TaxID=51811 RepID=A0ABY6KR97_9ARAC|nr:ZC3H12C [Cordylochernes scorpioides]